MEKGNKYWESVVETANEELAELYAERDELTARLEQIGSAILQREQVQAGLERLIAKEVAPPSAAKVSGIAALSLAAAVRAILQTIQTHQTARGIRDILDASGYDLKQHANPLASIHGILKRLFESGEAVVTEAQGKTFYRIARLKMNRGPSRGLGQFNATAKESSLGLLSRFAPPKRAESAVEQMIEQVEDTGRKKRNSFVSAIEELGKPKKD